MQNPPRVFDQHFGEDFKSMTYWQVQEAKHRGDVEFKAFQKQIKKLKKQVTLRLGVDVIAYFKGLAQETGIPYQNLINLYLKECAHSRKKLILKWAV